jgi:hypothetical protein
MQERERNQHLAGRICTLTFSPAKRSFFVLAAAAVVALAISAGGDPLNGRSIRGFAMGHTSGARLRAFGDGAWERQKARMVGFVSQACFVRNINGFFERVKEWKRERF